MELFSSSSSELDEEEKNELLPFLLSFGVYNLLLLYPSFL
jgi:hypothetical protein